MLPSEETIREELKKVMDPELHIDVVNLGLIYGIERDEEKDHVHVRLGLTSPACPYAPQLRDDAQATVSKMENVKSAEVELTLTPPWDPRTMASDEAKDVLGIY
ncbi:MAG: metal-sulfur cluster assembly factor [Deltaproteobacteria bacterium]|nr:metal-sulfur cluster assembly factor [Deltaproteobacteria bacterium]